MRNSLIVSSPDFLNLPLRCLGPVVSSGRGAQPSRCISRPRRSPHFRRFTAERIRAHVRFLSHDLLEGRGTGQRGGDIAAEYIATQFALYGLKPAGDNGTYMQKVPMVGVTTTPRPRSPWCPRNGPGPELKPLTDYVASTRLNSRTRR